MQLLVLNWLNLELESEVMIEWIEVQSVQEQ